MLPGRRTLKILVAEQQHQEERIAAVDLDPNPNAEAEAEEEEEERTYQGDCKFLLDWYKDLTSNEIL